MNNSPDISILSDNVDKSQVPPIEQKRMVAFINEFIVATVSFLNDFMTKCEMRFVEFEQKMQRIESSLLIVEAKMASIPDVESKSPSNDKRVTPVESEPQASTEVAESIPSTSASTSDSVSVLASQATENQTQTKTNQDERDNASGVKACDDTRYRKYFKMLQFGVPAPAVKLKMANEGIDPNVLDDPNRILEDGVCFVATDE